MNVYRNNQLFLPIFYVQLATENKKSAPVIRTDADYLYSIIFLILSFHKDYSPSIFVISLALSVSPRAL